MDNPVRVEITRCEDEAMVSLNGSPAVPVADYAVQPAEDGGRALVSLVVPADMVSIGRSPASTPAPAAVEEPRVAVWGRPTRDPRADIPGWVAETLGAQVAANAQAMHR